MSDRRHRSDRVDAGPPPSPPAGATPGVRRRRSRDLLGVVPFFAFVGVFLVIPTLVVVIGAFAGDGGGFTLANLAALTDGYIVDAFVPQHRAVRGHRGARRGLRRAARVRGRHRRSRTASLRRVVTAACGVLAQFGGVTLAFAFIATLGLSGFVTVFLRDQLGIDLYAGGVVAVRAARADARLHVLPDPADGDRLPARAGRHPATVAGGDREPRRLHLDYWRRVAGPLLAPAFLGSTLLLFANAFSAYATAAALVSQGSPIVPLQIRSALTSEVRPRPGEPRQGDGARHGRRGRGRDVAVRAAAAEDVAMAGLVRRRVRRQRVFRWVVVDRARGLLPAAAVRDAGVHHPGPGGTLTWDTWRLLVDWRAARRDLPGPVRRASKASLGLAVLTVAADAGAAGADRGLGAAAAAAAAPAGRVPLPAAADHPGDRAGGRPGAGVRVGQLLPRRLVADADLRVHDPGPAVRLPRHRRRACPRSTCARWPRRPAASAPAGPP